MGRRSTRLIAAVLGIVLVAGGAATVSGFRAASAAPVSRALAAQPKALILADSVTVPGPAPAASSESLEQFEAEQDGFAVTSVTGTQWDAMSAVQFAAYQVVIIGDAECPEGNDFAAAVSNETVWEPVVMSSGGNKVVIGTDPTFHTSNASAPNAPVLEANGIAFAGKIPGATGAYIDLSCAYESATANTPVPLLDGLSTHGAGQFQVIGESPLEACATAVNVVAQTGPTAGLTDADLSNWDCSVHEAFQTFPSDYTPLALAPASSGFPASYCADEVGTTSLVCGAPYIMLAGPGVVVNSLITLTPASQTLVQGGTATLTATVFNSEGGTEGGEPVTFSVDSGPDTGKTLSGTTGDSGTITFSVSDTTAPGTDSVSATFDNDGQIQKATAAVTWEGQAAVTLLPASQTLVPGGTATLTATVTNASGPVSGGAVSFSVVSGPDAGKTFAGTTGATGTITFTYSDARTVGTDSVSATFTDGVQTDKATATVVWKGTALAIDTTSSSINESSTTDKVSTKVPGDLLVAFVAGDEPAKGGQRATVSGGGLAWKLVGRENAPSGDVEIWAARAARQLTSVPITVTGQLRGWDEAVTIVAFMNAPGTGAVAKAHSASGAPSATLTTTAARSWVFAVGADWLKFIARTPGASQFVVSTLTDHDPDQETFWVQARKALTPTAGTKVLINDTKPVKDPCDLVLVEIR